METRGLDGAMMMASASRKISKPKGLADSAPSNRTFEIETA